MVMVRVKVKVKVKVSLGLGLGRGLGLALGLHELMNYITGTCWRKSFEKVLPRLSTFVVVIITRNLEY